LLGVLLALFAGACGGSDSDDDGGVRTTEPAVTTVDDGATDGENCRMETVEDEYGFEVEIEVCD